MSTGKPNAAERIAWIRKQQRQGRCPNVDLYICSCGVWTMAVKDTPNVRCTCGEAPAYFGSVLEATPEGKEQQG